MLRVLISIAILAAGIAAEPYTIQHVGRFAPDIPNWSQDGRTYVVHSQVEGSRIWTQWGGTTTLPAAEYAQGVWLCSDGAYHAHGVTRSASQPTQFSPWVIRLREPAPDPDVDGDGDSDMDDFAILQRSLGDAVNPPDRRDLNHDLVVDGLDVEIFVQAATGPSN